MRTHTTSTRIAASVLSVLLLSCGASRHIAPSSAEELSRLVLFIQDQPDGTVTHSWRRAEELDHQQYRFLSASRSAARHIVLAMGRKRDCDEENRECIRECMSRPLPRGFGHITSGGRGLGGKEEYCNDKCMQPYLDCTRLQELQPQEFTAVDDAVDWVKRNRRSILVGSVIIVAGVAFVVISAGAGIVVLAPAVLLAAPATEPEPYMAEVSP
jgi:hypothetical protein